MKNKLILSGVIVMLGFVGTTLIFNPGNRQTAYKPRQIENGNPAIIEGALDHYYKLRGDFTREDWLRVKIRVDEMATNRTAFNWRDQGPDNVGGRTRAICIDRNDYHHLYAGSVSGGLYESYNRANNWSKVVAFEENLAISSMCQIPNGTYFIATGHQQEQTSGSQNAYDTGANGGGVFEMIQHPDGTHTVTVIPGTDAYTYINEVVCDTIHNLIWIATNQGLKTYDPATLVLTSISNGLGAGACNALSISPEGQVIVAGMSGGRTYVSQDYGASFTNYSSPANTLNPIAQGSARIEYGISFEKTGGNYIIYASAANSNLTGIWKSADNGVNWQLIAPATDGLPGSFDPFDVGAGGQGTWDNVITAFKGNPQKLILGGIDSYSWATTENWSQLSQWFLSPTNDLYLHADQHDLVFDKTGRLYIGNDGGVFFSDDGGLTFHPANRGYNVTQFYTVGFSAYGDVIGGTQDNGVQANYHQNGSWQEHETVGGGDGFSSSISFINRDILFGSTYYAYVFRSANRGQISTPFYPQEFALSGPGALGCSPGAADGNGCGQFFTTFTLWENPNDLDSKDSIDYIPQQAYTAGDVVEVPSRTTQVNIDYVTPTDIVFDSTVDFDPLYTTYDTVITSQAPSTNFNLAILDYTFVSGSHPISSGDIIYFPGLDTSVVVSSYSLVSHYWGTNALRPGKIIDMWYNTQVQNIAWDTLRVQDPFQSWFAIGLGGANGVWMTRNALRFSAPANEWFKVADGIPEVSAMEFSRDGNNLFIGTWSGNLFRLSGFGNVYSPAKQDNIPNGIYKDTLIDVTTPGGAKGTTFTLIGSFGAPVTGIGVESDIDHVVVALGHFTGSDKVRETMNATGGVPTWLSISGNLPSLTVVSMPLYSVVIDRDDPSRIIVGGEFGTFYTENGGTIWENCSDDFGKSPVFDMGQNWRTWNEGCHRPGEIYIGTHGRGIWSSDAYLGVTEQDQLSPEKFTSSLIIYPNPLTENGTLSFELETSSDVQIRIFNLSGQVVAQYFQNNVPAGKNTFSFETGNLPNGVYIVRLSAEGKDETVKFTKN